VTTADAGLDQTLCDTATMVTLVANNPTTGTGVWTISSGSGTITDALNSSTTVTGLTGSITMTWTISTTGICPSSSDDVVITLDNCVDFSNPPSGFTPDGDGVNDTWEIPGLSENYPESQVEVFTRWGAKIFVSDTGYTEPWDGTYKGSNMPLGAYYFVIYFNDGSTEPMKGTVTIIR
jgi:gliding motility-associated-like protein